MNNFRQLHHAKLQLKNIGLNREMLLKYGNLWTDMCAENSHYKYQTTIHGLGSSCPIRLQYQLDAAEGRLDEIFDVHDELEDLTDLLRTFEYFTNDIYMCKDEFEVVTKQDHIHSPDYCARILQYTLRRVEDYETVCRQSKGK